MVWVTTYCKEDKRVYSKYQKHKKYIRILGKRQAITYSVFYTQLKVKKRISTGQQVLGKQLSKEKI